MFFIWRESSLHCFPVKAFAQWRVWHSSDELASILSAATPQGLQAATGACCGSCLPGQQAQSFSLSSCPWVPWHPTTWPSTLSPHPSWAEDSKQDVIAPRGMEMKLGFLRSLLPYPHCGDIWRVLPQQCPLSCSEAGDRVKDCSPSWQHTWPCLGWCGKVWGEGRLMQMLATKLAAHLTAAAPLCCYLLPSAFAGQGTKITLLGLKARLW